MKLEIVSREKLIMVMGSQRSGTSALTESLGQDPKLRVETEHPNNAFYVDYYLRPEVELRPILWRIRRRVILKPISETLRRSVDDVLDEFADYGVQLVWIYRDPVNVWLSNMAEFGRDLGEMDVWLAEWNRRNRSVLEALSGKHRRRIVVVRYEDLLDDPRVHTAICAFLGLEEVNNLFVRLAPRKDRPALDSEILERIRDKTQSVRSELDRVRIQPRRTSSPGRRSFSMCMDGTQWKLNIADGAAGTLQHSDGRSVRVAVDQAEGDIKNAVVAELSPIGVERGLSYSYSCWIRSDCASSAMIGLGRNQEPWDSYGGCHRLELTSDWKFFVGEFEATEDEPNGRIFVILDSGDAPVEVADLQVQINAKRHFELALNDGGAAEVVVGDDPTVARFRGVRGDQPWNVQWTSWIMPLRAGTAYAVRVRVRSDRPRKIGLAVGEYQPPWERNEFYRSLATTADWRDLCCRFRASKDGPARVYFDLSGDEGDVELVGGSLEEVDGEAADLLCAEGRSATLKYPDDPRASMRVEFVESGDQTPTGVLLKRNVAPVSEGIRYSVSFRMRADQSRTADVGLTGAVDGVWENGGLHQRINLLPQWRRFYYEFVAERTCEESSIYFELGADAAAVEIADLQFDVVDDELSDEEIDDLSRILSAVQGNASPRRLRRSRRPGRSSEGLHGVH